MILNGHNQNCMDFLLSDFLFLHAKETNDQAANVQDSLASHSTEGVSKRPDPRIRLFVKVGLG